MKLPRVCECAWKPRSGDSLPWRSAFKTETLRRERERERVWSSVCVCVTHCVRCSVNHEDIRRVEGTSMRAMNLRLRVRAVRVASSGLKGGFGGGFGKSTSLRTASGSKASKSKMKQSRDDAVDVPAFSLPLTIRQYPDPILRCPAKTVDVSKAKRATQGGDNLQKLADEMFRYVRDEFQYKFHSNSNMDTHAE